MISAYLSIHGHTYTYMYKPACLKMQLDRYMKTSSWWIFANEKIFFKRLLKKK